MRYPVFPALMLFLILIAWVCSSCTVPPSLMNVPQTVSERHAIVRSGTQVGSGVWIGGSYFLSAKHILSGGERPLVLYRKAWHYAKVLAEDNDVVLLQTGHNLEDDWVVFQDKYRLGERVWWIQVFFESTGPRPVLQDGVLGQIERDTLVVGNKSLPGASGTATWNDRGEVIGINTRYKSFVFDDGSFQVVGHSAIAVSGLNNIRRYLNAEKVSKVQGEVRFRQELMSLEEATSKQTPLVASEVLQWKRPDH